MWRHGSVFANVSRRHCISSVATSGPLDLRPAADVRRPPMMLGDARGSCRSTRLTAPAFSPEVSTARSVPFVSSVIRDDRFSSATSIAATYQEDVASRLPRSVPSIHANFYPTWDGPDDDTMHTRSVSFLALGVLAATAISQFRGDRIIDLVIAENGFIALNAPLTPRRVGTLSTRTAHPHFLGEMQTILDAVGLPVRIENTCRHQTKGEMLRGSIHEPDFAKLAVATVSCGKWKRRNIQCGRCVPCLVRRAAFHAAALPDTTPYEWANLPDVLIDEDGRDDVVAAMTAVRRLHRRGAVAPWVLQAGPLPEDPSDRLAYVDVFRRGILELQSFLKASGLP